MAGVSVSTPIVILLLMKHTCTELHDCDVVNSLQLLRNKLINFK